MDGADGMGGTLSTDGQNEKEVHIEYKWENLKERDYFVHLDVDDRILTTLDRCTLQAST
jgi:hypothetical protein